LLFEGRTEYALQKISMKHLLNYPTFRNQRLSKPGVSDMALSQAKRSQSSSHATRSPHLGSESELYVPSFTQASPPSVVPQPPATDPQQVRRLTLAILLTLAVLISLTTTLAYGAVTTYGAIEQRKLASAAVEQRQMIRTQQMMISHIESLQDAGGEANYSECITDAKRLLAAELYGTIYMQAKAALRDCQVQIGNRRIVQAQQAAAEGNLRIAIALAHQVEGDKQPEAQQLIKTWSTQIMKLAEDAYNAGELHSAVGMAGAIVRSNPLYAASQAKIENWNREWAANTAHLQVATAAVNADQLETARFHVRQLTSHPYWLPQTQELQTAIEQRQTQYDRLYKEAQSSLELNQCRRSLDLANQLPNTMPWANLKQSLTKRAESACNEATLQTGVLTWVVGVISGWLIYFRGRRIA
jgi:hypothetical protein